MEFHEYYQIIRTRLALPIVLALFAILLVAVLYLTSGKEWKAQGQMLAQPGAGYSVRWAGSTVDVGEGSETWGTLQQLVQSRVVAEQAAGVAGIPLDGLKGFVFERGTRGDMFRITGSADSPEKSVAYVSAGMQATQKLLNETRLQRAEAVRADLQKRAAQAAPRREAIQERLARMETGPPAGKPPDVLTWTQTQIASTDGAIATASVDIGMARDRLNSLSDFARRERSVPPQQRLMGDTATVPTPTTTLQSRLTDLQGQRTKMLQTRTGNHPEVVALDREIAATQQQLTKANEENGPVLNRLSPSLQQQLVLAESELGAAQRRVDVLRNQSSDLRARIPALQARARDYTALVDQLEPLNNERASLLANLNMVGDEIVRLRGTQDLQVIDPPQVIGTSPTVAKLVLTMVAALIGGFIIGLMVIFALHYMEVGRTEPEPVKAPA